MPKWGDVLTVAAAAGLTVIGLAAWRRRALAKDQAPAARQVSTVFLSATGSPDRVGESDYWRSVTPRNYDSYAANLAASENRLAELNRYAVGAEGWYVG